MSVETIQKAALTCDVSCLYPETRSGIRVESSEHLLKIIKFPLYGYSARNLFALNESLF